MKVSVSNFFFILIASTLLLVNCSQRDNRHDPYSPLFRISPPVFEVSLIFLDSSKIVENIGDSQFVVIPPLAVILNFFGYDFENNNLSVLYRETENGYLKRTVDRISSTSAYIADSGKKVITLEIEDKHKQKLIKTITFNAKPGRKPEIDSLSTEHDTIKIGEFVDTKFIIKIADSALMLDSIKYIHFSKSEIKRISKSSPEFIDTSSFFTLNSPKEYITEVMAIIVDKIGRTDTARIPIVFNKTGKIGDRKPPEIDSIVVNNYDSLYLFNASVTVYNGKKLSDLKYFWEFSDTRISRDVHPYLVFPVAGTYSAYLSIIDTTTGLEAKDSISFTVFKTTSLPPKIDSLSIVKDSLNPQKFDFTINMKSDLKVGCFVTWFFGQEDDTTIFNSFEVSHTFTMPGSYLVKAVVKNIAGSDTISKIITVEGLKFIKVSPPDSAPAGQEVTFTINSLSGTGNLNYIWAFPDPDTMIIVDTTVCKYTFKNPGNHTISLYTLSRDDMSAVQEPVKLEEIVYIVY